MWPRFAGWSLSRQQGPDSPRTPDDFYCLALGHWSGQAQFQGKDPVKAAGYTRTAAEQNHPATQGLYGYFLSKGIGLKADPAAAITWWRKGAAQANADSLNALAAAYESGEGVAADKQEALRRYRQAAERGSTRPAVDVSRRAARRGRAGPPAWRGGRRSRPRASSGGPRRFRSR